MRLRNWRRKKIKILTIDPGSNTGWSLSDNSFLEFGVENFSPKRGESRGMVFLNMRHWLKKMLTQGFPKVQLVAYEKPFSKGQAAREIAIGMITRIEEECEQLGIDYTFVYPTNLKKRLTGKGKASKDLMLEEARRRYPDCVIQSYDEADALLILSYVKEEYLK